MRGDSIRDFYAKTLALVGLGVLAGTGALVDYWPSYPGVLPAAQLALSRPALAIGLQAPAPEMPVLIPVPAVQAGRTAAPAPLPEPPVLSVTVSVAFPVGHEVALSAPPLLALAAVPLVASAGEEIAFSEPASVVPVAAYALLNGPSAPAEDDDDWWITGAVKWTGSSIARTGRKTGASVLDIFRVVKGAVRKALPDFEARTPAFLGS